MRFSAQFRSPLGVALVIIFSLTMLRFIISTNLILKEPASRSSARYNCSWMLEASNRSKIFILSTKVILESNKFVNPTITYSQDEEFSRGKVIIAFRMHRTFRVLNYLWYDLKSLKMLKTADYIEEFWPDQSRPHPYEGVDPILFYFNGSTYILARVQFIGGLSNDVTFNKVVYNKEIDAFYAQTPHNQLAINGSKPYYLSLPYAVGSPANSYSPFEYCPITLPSCQRAVMRHGYLNESNQYAKLFFITSIDPHIVQAPPHPFHPSDPLPMTAHFRTRHNLLNMISMTSLAPNSTWRWGHLIPATPAVRVSATHYFAFFSSIGKVNHNHVYTYLVGAYMFASLPPFAITHMSSEPIVDPTFIPTHRALRGVDFVIVPSGILLSEEDDTISMSFGRDDMEGWLITFNRTLLLDSLRPVSSVVEGDSVWSEDMSSFADDSYKSNQ